MAKTRVDLKPPYDREWKAGYLVINPEGRRTLILYNSHKDRTSTQYARYLKAVELGRYLNEKETVDHIDGDPSNDSIENLQILSMTDNVRKSHCKPLVELICPICKIHFTRTRTQLRGRLHKVESNSICCSRSCGGKKL